jgi:hypothetical protein
VLQGPTGIDKVAGLFDAFEKSRLVGKQVVSAEVPKDLQVACAPLFVDQKVLAAKLAAIGRP